MKKGFTLVELLAVIIILGVLSVLIVPKVINTLNDSEEKTNMASAEGLLKAAEYKYQDNEINGVSDEIIIDYELENNIDYLDYSGIRPEVGKISIKPDGKIAMAVKIGEYCYIKSYDSNEINKIEYSNSTCGSNADVFTNYTLPQVVTSGDGLYESAIEKGRYIYRGQNPNNWIWLDENGDTIKSNSELYRIIAFETNGKIKAIKNDTLGTKEWDELGYRIPNTQSNVNVFCTLSEMYGCNAWVKSSEVISNYPNSQIQVHNEDRLTVSKNASLQVYLNETWLNSTELSKYIIKNYFYIGGVLYFPEYTAGSKGLLRERQEEKTQKWDGYIGLINITEYIEASTNPTCTSIYSNYSWGTGNYYDDTDDGIDNKTQHNNTYDSWPCSNRNYNWMSGSMWTITPATDNEYDVWLQHPNGGTYNGYASYTFDVKPVLFIKPSVELSGLGTQENPYEITNL